jgi:hypothetical protein
MPENKSSEKINREADILIELGTLLRKERSAQKNAQVQKIFESDLSDEEKVEQIKRLDSETGVVEQEQKRQNGKNGADRGERVERYFGTVPPKEKKRRGKKRSRSSYTLKHHFQRPGYFSFLFRHYGKIKEFGFSTRTMVSTIFPPGIKADREMRSALEIQLKPVAKEVAVILNQLMGNSWLFLHKKEYNLLVLLTELCNSIESTEFTSLNFNDPKVSERLKQTEHLFWLLHYRKEYFDQIRTSIDLLLEKNRRNIRNLELLPGMIKKLMAKNELRPSLYNVLLAVNMMRYRRYITQDALLIEGHGELIGTREFDCEEETAEKIDEHISKLITQLELLEKERKEILKVRAFMQRDENGNVDIEPLRSLYESGVPSKKVSFEKEKDKLLNFLGHFTRAFLEVFEDLLCCRVRISGIGSVILFEGDPFRKDLGKLQMISSKCEDLNFQLPVFSQKRYMEITIKHAQAIESEAEAVSLIGETVASLRSIASRIIPLLHSGPFDRIVRAENFQKIGLGVSDYQKTPFPSGNLLENSGTYVEGRSIGDIFSLLVSVSYLFGFFFNDRNVLNVLRRENQVQHDMEGIIETIERLATADVYQDIRDHFL